MHTDPDINYLTKENPFFEIGIESVLGIEMQVFKNRPKNLGSFIELSKNHDQNIMSKSQTRHFKITKISQTDKTKY